MHVIHKHSLHVVFGANTSYIPLSCPVLVTTCINPRYRFLLVLNLQRWSHY